jgi:uncharacterized protein (TIGR03000 family)
MESVMRIAACVMFGMTVQTGMVLAQQPVQPTSGVKSKVKVTVPQDDAELYVEQKKTSTIGKIREFDTPDNLKAGTGYVYEFKVTWKPNKFTTMTRTRVVKFTAGNEVLVDFTQPSADDKAVVTLAPPTDDVIAELVKAAKITATDVVFEPGGGDARTLIAAVKAGAKRGVLVQPDEAKVKAAKDQVKMAEMEGKVDVQQAEPGDGKDYAEATVVFLYLGEELNTALRPVLLRDLKPGSRIVSHRFKMGDWPPATTTKAVSADGEYEVYTWTVAEADKQKYGKK